MDKISSIWLNSDSMKKAKKRPGDLGVAADMSEAAIERRWRDVAQLHRLGLAMQTARHTGRRARDQTDEE